MDFGSVMDDIPGAESDFQAIESQPLREPVHKIDIQKTDFSLGI